MLNGPPLKWGNGIRVVSLFSGGGGLDLGFHQAGFETALATDLDGQSCETMKTNKPRYLPESATVLKADIRLLDKRLLPTNVDLVIGGPPCQAFSAFGRRAGGAAGRLDDRGTLFKAFADLIAHLSPKAFVFENVRGILATNKGEDWSAVRKEFAKIGYTLSYKLLDACDYGIPQHRERLFLVGHSAEIEFLFPAPIFGPDSESGLPHTTIGRAIHDLQQPAALLATLGLTGGKYAGLLGEVPRGGNYLHFTAQRGYPNPVFAYRSRFSDFLYKADPEKPLKTIIASPGKYSGPFHWDGRTFSIEEYRRIQGFPDDYNFTGTRAQVVSQIGNSVSPFVAFFMAAAVARQVFGRASVPVKLLEPNTKLSFDSRKSSQAKKTREQHVKLAAGREASSRNWFNVESYAATVHPFSPAGHHKFDNVTVSVEGTSIKMLVQADHRGDQYLTARLRFYGHQPDLFTTEKDVVLDLRVELLGKEPHAIQTMWNAIDDLVIRSSSFHSLFEIYGHFTEPHPIFVIEEFIRHSDHPVAVFAAHAADFANCSRYFNRKHLIKMFGDVFGTRDFAKLAEILRRYRFDIRCHETNVAIPNNLYMVAYPFTLPSRRQMNFSVKPTAKPSH